MSLPESLLSTLMFAQISLDTTQHKAAFAHKGPLTPTLSPGEREKYPRLQVGLAEGSSMRQSGCGALPLPPLTSCWA